jgi:hypothetical protein
VDVANILSRGGPCRCLSLAGPTADPPRRRKLDSPFERRRDVLLPDARATRGGFGWATGRIFWGEAGASDSVRPRRLLLRFGCSRRSRAIFVAVAVFAVVVILRAVWDASSSSLVRSWWPC